MAVLARSSFLSTSTTTTMSVRYAPIPNPRTDPDTNPELDAAFDDSDDDDDDESRPLNPHRPPSPRPSVDHNTNTILTYDFNTPVADWDRPPPGSPPAATSVSLPNSIGNSNGIIPTSTPDISPRTQTSWWRRATAFLTQSSQSTSSRTARIMGGGTGNDGVFSNVSAKPTTSGTRVQEGRSLSSPPTPPFPHLFSSRGQHLHRPRRILFSGATLLRRCTGRRSTAIPYFARSPPSFRPLRR